MFYITRGCYDIGGFGAHTSVICVICAKAGVTCLWQITLLINWMCCQFYHGVKCKATAFCSDVTLKHIIQFLYGLFCKTVFLV